MGYLFDMLDKANGQNCQATNLLKAFSNSREASKLGLLEENLTNKALSGAIQSVNRFILNQISNEHRAVAPESDDLDRNLTTMASESVRCMFCRNEIVRPGNVFANELIYPVPDAKQVRRAPPIKFSSILKSSIERETQNRGWCNHCRRYQQVAIRKTVHRMPPVLMLNSGHTTPYLRQLWASPGWLPEELGLIVESGQLHCFEGDALRSRVQSRSPGLVIYELVGLVAEINITEHQKPHLVSFINVNVSARQPEEKSKWHLFNDFLVTEVSRDEALKFTEPWKVPSVVAYQVKGARNKLDDSWKDKLDTTLLFHEWSMKYVSPSLLTSKLLLTPS
jgi:PAB-dependent poly(A)-specific ribonuclease subunit 2